MNAPATLTIAFLMLSLSLGAQAAQAVRMTEGSFGFRATVEGEQFEARFGDFLVLAQLGPGRLPTGFTVEIAMAAIDSGNADRDAEMQLSEWFDTAAHPVARFQAQAVEKDLEGGYVAKGELQIKGVRRALAVPFAWHTDPHRLRLSGQVRLDRRWFGVGPEDDSSVAAEVTVFFQLAWGADG